MFGNQYTFVQSEWETRLPKNAQLGELNHQFVVL